MTTGIEASGTRSKVPIQAVYFENGTMSPGTLSFPETCVHVCIETCIKNILVYIYKRTFFISVDIIFKNMLKPYFGCFFHTREYIKSQVNLKLHRRCIGPITASGSLMTVKSYLQSPDNLYGQIKKVSGQFTNYNIDRQLRLVST